ncbi:CDP-glycerol glycerophosphotransferase family protein [Vibrio breoganii]
MKKLTINDLYKLKSGNRAVLYFQSYRGEQYSDSPRYIFEAIYQKYGNKFEYIWIVNESLSDSHKKELHCFEHVYIASYKSILSTLSLYISDRIITNTLLKPMWIKGPHQAYHQFWHGIPIKHVGLDHLTYSKIYSKKLIYKIRWLLESFKIDKLYVTSPMNAQQLSSAFNVRNGTICLKNLPRHENLVMNKGLFTKQKLLEKLKIESNDEVRLILYAPTWRDCNYNKRSETNFLENLMLDEKIIVLYRGHYYSTLEELSDKFVDVSDYSSINELVLGSDITVTDYSSVVFECNIINKPFVLFTPDFESYADRGLYFDYREIKEFKLTYDTKSLQREINNILESMNETNDYTNSYLSQYTPLSSNSDLSGIVNLIIAEL